MSNAIKWQMLLYGNAIRMTNNIMENAVRMANAIRWQMLLDGKCY